jgi:hypothetical protein
MITPATAGDDAELKELPSAYVVEFGDSYHVSCLTGLLVQHHLLVPSQSRLTVRQGVPKDETIESESAAQQGLEWRDVV